MLYIYMYIVKSSICMHLHMITSNHPLVSASNPPQVRHIYATTLFIWLTNLCHWHVQGGIKHEQRHSWSLSGFSIPRTTVLSPHWLMSSHWNSRAQVVEINITARPPAQFRILSTCSDKTDNGAGNGWGLLAPVITVLSSSTGWRVVLVTHRH